MLYLYCIISMTYYGIPKHRALSCRQQIKITFCSFFFTFDYRNIRTVCNEKYVARGFVNAEREPTSWALTRHWVGVGWCL